MFLARLLRRSALTVEEQEGILGLTGEERRYRGHIDIVTPGERVESACLVVSGLVARFDQKLDGQRQVTSYYIPGDMCDLHSVVAPEARWAITAVCDATVLRIPHSQLGRLCLKHPNVALAFWRDSTVDASIFAKWAGNLGRGSAKARIAHLFCEMGLRMESAGLANRTMFDFRATQEQLAEATGITSVHVNRTLQEIRSAGVLRFSSGHVNVIDWDVLVSIAEFDPAYLMLDQQPQRLTLGGPTDVAQATQPQSVH